MAKTKKSKVSKKVNGAAKPRKKGPRQEPLPGMEDRAIAELEDAALSYVEVRDERMELTKQEADSKARVVAIMKKNGKTEYRHGNVLVEIIPEDAKVKVKIAKDGEELPPKKNKSTDFDPSQMDQDPAASEEVAAPAEG